MGFRSPAPVFALPLFQSSMSSSSRSSSQSLLMPCPSPSILQASASEHLLELLACSYANASKQVFSTSASSDRTAKSPQLSKQIDDVAFVTAWQRPIPLHVPATRPCKKLLWRPPPWRLDAVSTERCRSRTSTNKIHCETFFFSFVIRYFSFI